MMPSTGYSTNGSSAVADRGMASVIHQVAISTATAAMWVTSGLEEPRPINRVTQNRIGPNRRPILWLVDFGSEETSTGTVLA